MRHFHRTRLAFTAGVLLISVAILRGDERRLGSGTQAIEIQLRLFDALAQNNPGYQDTAIAISQVDDAQQQRRIEVLSARNAQNPRIAALIDSLLSSPAYELYYRQFRNVQPETHRRIFLALPFRGIDSPAGIGATQLELFQNRERVATLINMVSRIDTDRVRAKALIWSPPTDAAPPTSFFILDGNGDAFAVDSHVCFDLYGVLLSKRPEANRYSQLGASAAAELEDIAAHEYQHVFAQPFLYPPNRSYASWQDRWQDILTRRIVSEGVAQQCNPPIGLKRAVFEDSVVVSYWLKELRRVMLQLRESAISEDSLRAWLDRSYHETARELLQGYLKRNQPSADQERLLSEHIADRPSAIYALGWWMMSRINAAPDGQRRVIDLLSQPNQLVEFYNQAIDSPSLRLDL